MASSGSESRVCLLNDEIEVIPVFHNDPSCDEDEAQYSHIIPSDYLQTDMQVSDDIHDMKFPSCRQENPVELTTFDSTISDNNQKVTCYYCHFITKSRKTLENHILDHFSSMPNRQLLLPKAESIEKIGMKKELLVCIVCSYKTPHSYRMKIHMITHTGNKPFTCNICSLSTSRKCDLLKHMKTHTGDKPFKCNECPYRAARRNTLTKHIVRRHSGGKVPDEVYVPVLNKAKSENILGKARSGDAFSKMYSKTDSPDKPFVCNKCTFIAYEKSTMKLHIMKLHTDERPFSCSSCSFQTFTNYNLKRHFDRVHAGKRPFACNLCSFRAVTNYHLKRHLSRVHVNPKHDDGKSAGQPKQFSCAHCYFHTSSNSSLSRHFNKVHAADLLNDAINEGKSLTIFGNDAVFNINTTENKV